ncbi:MAG: site-specific DNA-methyltransferase [Methanothrix sp.]|jgi:adenine-specific DNA-methyltransferase|nr:site-specific DNA-methyltransferase [Methanothrix sp.]
MARAEKGSKKTVDQYDHKDKTRLNNPPVGLVTPETDIQEETKTYNYDPHIDPSLQFDPRRSQIEKIIEDGLGAESLEGAKASLAKLEKLQTPYLNWAGKAEHTTFEVPTVSLHVHERIDPKTIIRAVRKGNGEEGQKSLFDFSGENPPLREAIEFYKHKHNWSNRLIAGDSLLVMNSLIEKEGMAGQVQMIYIDPPYGIRYGSNFQPFVNKRDVKDGKDEDLTQEPEMIKAFRDTWELGIHSYLTYLRDRLLLARELLSDSGSIFVQISDENLHHVRELMDEVFGVINFVSLIAYSTTSGLTSNTLSRAGDYLLWYCKDKIKIKYRQLFNEKLDPLEDPKSRYDQLEMTDGSRHALTLKEKATRLHLPSGARVFSLSGIDSQGSAGIVTPFEYEGVVFEPPTGRHWTANYPEGMERLKVAKRLAVMGKRLRYVRYFSDFPFQPIHNIWLDIAGSVQSRSDPKVYAVQTGTPIVARCLLMTTDPGDIVLDPTCGSGTIAYVGEEWGRRWITCDTSRVAIALAKQRLMTALFDYYELAYPDQGVSSGFNYKTVPHITLKSIAHNQEIDAIYERVHPKIEESLAELNRITGLSMEEWEVPRDWDKSWLQDAKYHFDQFWRLKREMQEAMDASIQKNAPQETLYDQPFVDSSKVRVTGPFTVEAVPAPVVKPLAEIEAPKGEADESIARSGETLRQSEWREELLKTGIRGKGGQKFQFSRVEPLLGARWLHADAETKNGDGPQRAVISFGPEHAPLDQTQVARAVEDAQKLVPKPKIVVFAAFQFDPEASKDIDEMNWPGVTLLKAQMNGDLLTEDLKKKRASNESFWLIGQPDVKLERIEEGDDLGKYYVEVLGFDYYNTRTGNVESGGVGNIALWMLDPDYDGRSLYPRQVFFPMAGSKDGWAKLARNLKAEIDEEKIEAYRGTRSLPFKLGDNKRAAVKIVDDRGIESLKILEADQ